MVDLTTPQATVAQQFMARKGLPDAAPDGVEKVDGQPCWYFTYELPEGTLELEVSWDGREWQTTVTLFTLAS